MSITLDKDGLRRHRRIPENGRRTTRILCTGGNNTCMKYVYRNLLCRGCASGNPRHNFSTRKREEIHNPGLEVKEADLDSFLTEYPPQEGHSLSDPFSEEMPALDQYRSNLLGQYLDDCVKEVERDIKRLRH